MSSSEDKKIEILKSINFVDAIYHCFAINNDFLLLTKGIPYYIYVDRSLYYFYNLDEKTIYNLRNIGEKRSKQIIKIRDIIKDLKYDELLSLYNLIHSYDNYKFNDIVDISYSIIKKDEIITIDNETKINNKFLWEIFMQRLQQKSYKLIAEEFNINLIKLNGIINKIIKHQRESRINYWLNALSQKIEKEQYKVDYIYTYNEIKIIFNDDVVTLLKYYKFLNNYLSNRSYYGYNNKKLFYRVENEDLQSLILEINNNRYLSEEDKMIIINKLENIKKYKESTG